MGVVVVKADNALPTGSYAFGPGCQLRRLASICSRSLLCFYNVIGITARWEVMFYSQRERLTRSPILRRLASSSVFIHRVEQGKHAFHAGSRRSCLADAPVQPHLVGGGGWHVCSRYRILLENFRSKSSFSSIPEVITFTLPLAVISLYLFHHVLKGPLLELAPDGLRRRLFPHATSFAFGGVRRFAAIIGCVSLGIATHVTWDAFTHRETWASRHWQWLGRTGNLLGKGATIPNYDLLQYVSSALGCVLIAGWFVHWYRSAKPLERIPQPVFQPGTRLLLAVCMLLLPLCVGAVGAIRLTITLGHLPHVKPLGKYLIFVPGTLLLVEISLLSLLLGWHRARIRVLSRT